MKKEIQVGDRVFIEQAWEDEAGNYHDEFATVKAIHSGFAHLEFSRPEITEFLSEADFPVDTLEAI